MQVALRWLLEQGVTPIVKSFNSVRMKENLKIFDWELSEADLEKAKEIPQYRGFKGERFVSEFGPYKTLQDLWDWVDIYLRITVSASFVHKLYIISFNFILDSFSSFNMFTSKNNVIIKFNSHYWECKHFYQLVNQNYDRCDI